MNERIKEIIKEAGIDGDSIHVYTRGFPQRLIKLVVNECASIYSRIDNGNEHLGTDNYLEALYKHFQE